MKKIKILVVEDESIVAKDIQNSLKHLGYDVPQTTSNGHEAFKKAKEEKPDLILMDLSLPDIDGMEVTRLLRKKQQYQQIPIIALTAHAMGGIQETTQEAGLNDFLSKPFLPRLN